MSGRAGGANADCGARQSRRVRPLPGAPGLRQVSKSPPRDLVAGVPRDRREPRKGLADGEVGRAVALTTPRRPPTLVQMSGIRGGWTHARAPEMPFRVSEPVGPVRSRERRFAAALAGHGRNGRAVAMPPMQEREGSRSRAKQTLGPRPQRASQGPERRRSLCLKTAAMPGSC
jgi:hypothetical protein